MATIESERPDTYLMRIDGRLYEAAVKAINVPCGWMYRPTDFRPVDAPPTWAAGREIPAHDFIMHADDPDTDIDVYRIRPGSLYYLMAREGGIAIPPSLLRGGGHAE